MASSILQRCAALLPPDVELRYAWTGQSGLKPTWRFLTYWLMFANKSWIVAVSADQVFVFRAGGTKFGYDKPKRLVSTLARSQVQLPERLHGSWTRITFGTQRMWISRRAYPMVGKAFGLATTAK